MSNALQPGITNRPPRHVLRDGAPRIPAACPRAECWASVSMAAMVGRAAPDDVIAANQRERAAVLLSPTADPQ